MKTVVKMFKPRFAPLVEAGTKRQTMRPRPKRARDYPEQGDVLSGREWVGAPYRSKQRKLIEGRVTQVAFCYILGGGRAFFINGAKLTAASRDAFAIADGFKDWAELVLWFEETHGLPFAGICIFWEIKYQPKAANV